MTINHIHYKMMITHCVRFILKSEEYKEQITLLPKGSSLADRWSRAERFEDYWNKDPGLL